MCERLRRGGYLLIADDRKHVALTAPAAAAVRAGSRTYTLIGSDGKPYESPVKGTLGGYAPRRVYGRLDCPNALRWLARGFYRKHRVFFLDEATAAAAGYHPCHYCMPGRYAIWERAQAYGRAWPEEFARLLAQSDQPLPWQSAQRARLEK